MLSLYGFQNDGYWNLIKQFEDTLAGWERVLEMNTSELKSMLAEMNKAKALIDDFNNGLYWVQQPDDIFVIPQQVENLWGEVILVVEEAIKFQESLTSSYCQK